MNHIYQSEPQRETQPKPRPARRSAGADAAPEPRSGEALSDEARIASAVSQLMPQAEAPPIVESMVGGGSNRRYARVRLADAAPGTPQSLVAMVLPIDPEARVASEEASGEVPSPTELPWLATRRHLADVGLRVPDVTGYARDVGIVLIEDLGDTTLAGWLDDGANPRDAYTRAVDVLLAWQHGTAGRTDGAANYDQHFDPSLLEWELWHYVEYGLEVRHDVHPSVAEREALGDAFSDLVAEIAALPRTLAHRDFQSHNLMVKRAPSAVGAAEASDLSGAPELVLIDFQDALVAPYVYDLVALLRDSYVELDDALLMEMVAHYASGRPDDVAPGTELDGVLRAFDVQTVQRKLKDSGRFVYFEQVKDLPDYLKFIPRNHRYVAAALHRLGDSYERLAELLCQLDPELREAYQDASDSEPLA